MLRLVDLAPPCRSRGTDKKKPARRNGASAGFPPPPPPPPFFAPSVTNRVRIKASGVPCGPTPESERASEVPWRKIGETSRQKRRRKTKKNARRDLRRPSERWVSDRAGPARSRCTAGRIRGRASGASSPSLSGRRSSPCICERAHKKHTHTSEISIIIHGSSRSAVSRPIHHATVAQRADARIDQRWRCSSGRPNDRQRERDGPKELLALRYA